jgi:hypothetical protein
MLPLFNTQDIETDVGVERLDEVISGLPPDRLRDIVLRLAAANPDFKLALALELVAEDAEPGTPESIYVDCRTCGGEYDAAEDRVVGECVFHAGTSISWR